MITRLEARAIEYSNQRYADTTWEKSTERHKEFCRGVAHRQILQQWELKHPRAVAAIIEGTAMIIDELTYARHGVVTEIDT